MQLLSVAIHALRPASFLIYGEEQGYDEAKFPINIKFTWEQEKNYPEKNIFNRWVALYNQFKSFEFSHYFVFLVFFSKGRYFFP